MSRLLPLLPVRLGSDARIYLEAEEQISMPSGFDVLKHARAGQVHGLLIKYRQP
jgi:ABC-type phosphate transport system auxiliary subunit